LSDWGIISLTGESDPYAQRILCDLTPQGVEIILSFFGMPRDTKLFRNWNDSYGAVASCLLPYELLVPLTKFILWDVEKAPAVIDGGSAIWAIDEDYLERYGRLEIAGLKVCRNNNPTGKERNVHQMTGRTV
jgi:hypothetical protein